MVCLRHCFVILFVCFMGLACLFVLFFLELCVDILELLDELESCGAILLNSLVLYDGLGGRKHRKFGKLDRLGGLKRL